MVTGHFRNFFQFLFGLQKKFFGGFDANAVQLIARRPSDLLQERLVQAAARHCRDPRQVVNANRSVTVFPEVVETAGDAGMVYREQIAAFPGNESCRRYANGLGGRCFAVHQLIEQLRATKAEQREILVHAGNRRLHGIHGGQGVIHANDTDLFGHRQSAGLANFNDFERVVVGCGKQRQRLGGSFQLRGEPVSLVLPSRMIL